MSLPASRGRQTSYFCLKAACSDEERLHSHQCDCKTGICTEGQINFCKLNNSRVTAGPLTEFLLPEDKRSLITEQKCLWYSRIHVVIIMKTVDVTVALHHRHLQNNGLWTHRHFHTERSRRFCRRDKTWRQLQVWNMKPVLRRLRAYSF